MFWGVHPTYVLSSKNAHPTNLSLIHSWVRGSTPVKAALLSLSGPPSTFFNEPDNNLLKVQRRESQELNQSNQCNKFFRSVSWMHVAFWGCHTFSSDRAMSLIYCNVVCQRVWSVASPSNIGTQGYSRIVSSSFFLEFTIKRYKFESWPMESSGSRTSVCEM